MPPVVAFSVGSFGDILAVLQLLYKLRGALNELTGAAAEMRVLIGDIDRMATALIQVKNALERRASHIQPDVSNGIRVAVATCEGILRAALRTVGDFKCRITRATGAAGWRAYCAVLGWNVLGGKQRVDALRTRLSEQLDVMQLYLALSQCCGQANIQESLESQGATLRRLCDVVQDIQLRFDVGAPSFMFWDQANGRYCTPLARTSLDRLRDVYMHLGSLACHDALFSPEAENPVRCLPLKFTAYAFCASANGISSDGSFQPSIQCCLFREKAFGKWQALVSVPFTATVVNDYAPVIKILLERNHGPSTPCTCNGESCSSKIQQVLNRRELFWKPLTSYIDATRDIADKFEYRPRMPLDRRRLQAILDSFGLEISCSNPELLHHTISALLFRVHDHQIRKVQQLARDERHQFVFASTGREEPIMMDIIMFDPVRPLLDIMI